MKNLFFLLTLTAATPAFAGAFDLGNGGHVVLCAPGVRMSHPLERGVAVLDLFESNRVHGWTYREFSKLRSLSLEAAFGAAVDEFLRLDSIERTEVLKNFRAFRKEAEFVPSLKLSRTTGTFVRLPPGCVLRQGAIQYVNRYGFGRHRLVLSRSVWDRMDNAQRAALLLHEYVYRRLHLIHGRCAYGATRQMVGFGLSDRNLRLSSEGSEHGRDIALQFCPRMAVDGPID